MAFCTGQDKLEYAIYVCQSIKPPHILVVLAASLLSPKNLCRTYRQYAEEHHIDAELRKLLPRDEGKPIEKPAERALRERM